MRRRPARYLLAAVLLGGLGVLPALVQEAAPASPDANKAVVRHYFEALSGGDLKKLDDVIAPDFVDRTPGNPNQTRGPGVVRDAQAKARELFTDVVYTVDDLLADGDHVAARYTVRARHKASGKSIEVTGASFFHLAGGRIHEGWIVNDQIELFRQLGYTLQSPQAPPPAATPPPAPAKPAG
ncbi:MAG TPA: ester cyclase [Thermoanaerobaculia bacterium]|jgi:ketosteroid isomerase-like protein|nr:ester cyclase [Thermoanaerobaculia bacterium]